MYVYLDVWHETPQHDGDAAAAILLVGRQCVDAMLPCDVHVAAEAEQHAVRLANACTCMKMNGCDNINYTHMCEYVRICSHVCINIRALTCGK